MRPFTPPPYIFAVVANLLLTGSLLAQTKPVMTLPVHSPDTPQASEGGFWRSDHAFDNFLRLKNVLLKSSLTVTPVIYMADGFEVDLKPVTLPPAGVASIYIRKALQVAGPAVAGHSPSYGTAGVKYKWSWSAVLATIYTVDTVQSLSYRSTLGADAQVVNDPASPKADRAVEGMWWAPHSQVDGFVALVNTNPTETTAQIALSDGQNQTIAQQAVSIAAHGTKLLSLAELLGSVKDVDATGSVSIHYTGVANSLLPYEGIEDRKAGYSASRSFVS